MINKENIPVRASLGTELLKNVDMLYFKGLYNILPNPDPLLKKLGKQEEAYEELLNDPHLYGIIQSRFAGTLGQTWEIYQEEASNELFEFTVELFDKIDINNLQGQILDAVLYGYNPIEIIWGYDGFYKPKTFLAKPRSWFKFDFENKLMYRDATNIWEYKLAPEYKFLISQHQATYINPYGVPLLAKVYWNVMFIKDGKKFWIVFTEKYGMPWVLGKYDTTLKEKDDSEIETLENEFLAVLEKMAKDGILVYPSGTDVTVQQGGTTASVDIYERLIDSCHKENATLILGHPGAAISTPGELGNASTASQVRQDIIKSDMMLCSQAMNELIQWICKLNFNEVNYPSFLYVEKTSVDLQLAQRDATLAPVMQASKLMLSKDYFVREHGYTEEDFKEAEEPIIKEPAKIEEPIEKELIEEEKPFEEPKKEEPEEMVEKYIKGELNFNELYGWFEPRFPNASEDIVIENIAGLVNDYKI